MNKIEIIRAQLNIAVEFMKNTPTRHGFVWHGEMPSHPDEYEPEDWLEGQNQSIRAIWESFLWGLDKEDMHEYRIQAEALEIADLLVEFDPEEHRGGIG